MVTHRRRVAARVAVALGAVLLSGCGAAAEAPKASTDPRAQGARPYSERGAPTGEHGGKRPRGLVILIHGGGWLGRDPSAMVPVAGYAAHIRAQGFETLNVDYGKGPEGMRDILRFYDRERARLGRRAGICAVGNSAGGHLTLMLAVRRPTLDCAISLAGPTDLAALADEPEGARAYALAAGAFGTDDLERWSPAKLAARIHAQVLQVAAREDPFVPLAQIRAMKAAKPDSGLVILPPGDAGFVHSTVDRAAGDAAVRVEDRFLQRAIGGR